MLNRLDEIDWKKLQHAYGSAADVPANIRGLLSSESSIREKSLSNLECSIFHQGSVYDATVPSVRFLVELSLNPDVQNREAILYLLAEIAKGDGWFTNHQSFHVIRQVYSEETIERNKAEETQLVSELRIELAQQAEHLTGLVEAESKDIRMAATHLLSLLPNRGELVSQTLLSRFRVESDDGVRANILRCLGRLAPEMAYHIANCVAFEDTPLLTKMIALAVVMTNGDATDRSKVMPVLAQSVLNADSERIMSYNRLPSTEEYFLDLAVPVAIQNKEFAEKAAGVILKLQRESRFPKFILDSRAIALLACVLYPGGDRVDLDKLEHWQKAAIWKVARIAWPEWNSIYGNIVDVLDRFSLPTTLTELASAIGHSTGHFGWRRRIDRTYADVSGKKLPWWRFW